MARTFAQTVCYLLTRLNRVRSDERIIAEKTAFRVIRAVSRDKIDRLHVFVPDCNDFTRANFFSLILFLVPFLSEKRAVGDSFVAFSLAVPLGEIEIVFYSFAPENGKN